MFMWKHDYSIEVNIPIRKIWEFQLNPNNWSKWMDQFDSFTYIGEIETGSIIKAKIKNRNQQISILFTDVKPVKEFSICMKSLLGYQESTCTNEEISAGKTRINITTKVKSLLVPFMKSSFKKKVEMQYSKYFESLELYAY